MDIDIRALEESVILFYRSETPQQAAAHEWLTQAQCSPQAWRFAWELMQPGKSCEVQFFGATTLHSKLMKFWHEIPKEAHEELKQKLLETIVTFGNGPKLVLDRLCISLSAFIVHMLSEWPTAIEDVVNTFKNQQIPNLNENAQMWIMMQILCGIPEEANAIYTSVARVNMQMEINTRAPFVINTVNEYIVAETELNLSGDDMTTVLKAVKCVAAWIKNCGIPLDGCQFIVNSLLKLINKCYWHSIESDGCMSAEANELSDVCLETLHTIMVQPDAHRYSNSALQLMKMCLDSLTQITQAEWKENNFNEDIAVGIYNLIISSIECHSRLLLAGLATESEEHKSLYMRLIQIVLECTNKPGIYPVEESCSTLAMGFWYMLQDEILSMGTAEQRTQYLELIKPLYTHLTKILVRKSQHPNEIQLERWSLDDMESFRCYRQDIADTLIYCYEVLGDEILGIFSLLFEETLCFIQSDINEWPKLEASIFSFHSIAEHLDASESKYLPKFIEILAELPYKKLNSKVLGTALEVIGAYSEWFKENPSYIRLAIELLVKGLNSSKASQATLGLKDLTRECQKQMKEYAEPLLDACQQLLNGGQLKSPESIRLMYSVGKLMSMLPADKIAICLDSMVSPCFKEMYMIAEAGTITESSRIRILYCLKMISTLFSSLNTNTDEENPEQSSSNAANTSGQIQPVLIVMEKTMPIFKKICDIYINDEKVIEELCNALRYAVLNLLNDVTPMLPDICYLILSMFRSKCPPKAMDIARICIRVFYKQDQFKQTMQELFYSIVDEIFKRFDQTDKNQFSDISDVVESFYAFHAQILKKLPNIYQETNIDCKKLMMYALIAITLPENGPVKYAIAFISHFILQSRNYPNMTSTVLEYGENLVRTTILCIGEITPRSQVDLFAEIFLSINKKYPSELIAWLKVLETPNFPNGNSTLDEKQAFMKAVIREKVNKRLIQSQIREFALKSRGLIEKAY